MIFVSSGSKLIPLHSIFMPEKQYFGHNIGHYQDIHRPLLREEGDGAPASSGTQ